MLMTVTPSGIPMAAASDSRKKRRDRYGKDRLRSAIAWIAAEIWVYWAQRDHIKILPERAS